MIVIVEIYPAFLRSLGAVSASVDPMHTAAAHVAHVGRRIEGYHFYPQGRPGNSGTVLLYRYPNGLQAAKGGCQSLLYLLVT